MTATPDTVLDRGDPGDDTQRRFRYQHAYGVILIVASATKQQPYIAIWCEHHEDLLGEKEDRHFDSFQVKTRMSEQGPWKLNDGPLTKSLKRFVQLDERFPDGIDRHNFVSNAKPFETSQEEQLKNSPVWLLQNVSQVDALEDLGDECKQAIEALAGKIEVDSQALFETLRRVDLVKGPTLDGFEAEVAHTHLPRLGGCSNMTPVELDELRDEMIHAVFKASSLTVADPATHWVGVMAPDRSNPRLRAKRLAVDVVVEEAITTRAIAFRFTPIATPLSLNDAHRHWSALDQKFEQGDLLFYQDTMKHRAISAERHLLDLTAQDAEQASRVVTQLRGVVKGACMDAHAIASAQSEPWGPQMYRDVIQRLRETTTNDPSSVCHQPIDCLIGVAGLLTDGCEVWWSPKFQVEDLA